MVLTKGFLSSADICIDGDVVQITRTTPLSASDRTSDSHYKTEMFVIIPDVNETVDELYAKTTAFANSRAVDWTEPFSFGSITVGLSLYYTLHPTVENVYTCVKLTQVSYRVTKVNASAVVNSQWLYYTQNGEANINGVSRIIYNQNSSYYYPTASSGSYYPPSTYPNWYPAVSIPSNGHVVGVTFHIDYTVNGSDWHQDAQLTFPRS